jgi:CheY-like chemotaxis protein
VVVAAADAGIRHLLRMTFEQFGIPLHEAEDAAAAIAFVRISRPALLVVDSDLAGRDGIEVCREIKRDADLRETHVIVISGWTQPAVRDRALEAGAEHFMAKPFRPSELVGAAARACAAPAAREIRAQPTFGRERVPAERALPRPVVRRAVS